MAKNVAETSLRVFDGSDIDESVSHATYEEVRRGFEEFIRVNFKETGLLSREQVADQERFMAEAAKDSKKLDDARAAYTGAFAQQSMEENRKMYYKEVLGPLDDAVKNRVISKKSYDEWMKWIRDETRAAPEKKASIKSVLPKYLADRQELADARKKILEDKRLSDAQSPELKSIIADIGNDQKFLESLSFSERKGLLDRAAALLSVMEGGEEHKKLLKKAESILKDATKEPQPALHKDKVGTWLKRVFESGASPEEIEKFLNGTDAQSLQGLIKTWREVAVQFWYARADNAFDGVKTGFVNTKGFLWMNYKERVKYVKFIRDQAKEARDLRTQARSRIAASKGALGKGGQDRWLNKYVFNGSHTLPELKNIIAGDMATRLDEKVRIFQRYSKAVNRSKKYQGVRGLAIPKQDAFLEQKFPAQKAFVVEMELRLDQLEKNSPKFLVIRNAMDREDWEDALDLIDMEEKKDLSFDDHRELASMRNFIKQRSKTTGKEQKTITSKVEEVQQIDGLIQSLPPDLQDLVITLASYGADCVRMFGWSMYNREWCNRHGYLDPDREQHALSVGKEQALQKMRKKKTRGVVHENITGKTGEKEYIELSRAGATNVCLDLADSGAKSAMARTVHSKRSDVRTWYWTNTILHRGGGIMQLEQQIAETKKIYTIGRLLRSLEQKGEHYNFRGKAADLSQKQKPQAAAQMKKAA